MVCFPRDQSLDIRVEGELPIEADGTWPNFEDPSFMAEDWVLHCVPADILN